MQRSACLWLLSPWAWALAEVLAAPTNLTTPWVSDSMSEQSAEKLIPKADCANSACLELVPVNGSSERGEWDEEDLFAHFCALRRQGIRRRRERQCAGAAATTAVTPNSVAQSSSSTTPAIKDGVKGQRPGKRLAAAPPAGTSQAASRGLHASLDCAIDAALREQAQQQSSGPDSTPATKPVSNTTPTCFPAPKEACAPRGPEANDRVEPEKHEEHGDASLADESAPKAGIAPSEQGKAPIDVNPRAQWAQEGGPKPARKEPRADPATEATLRELSRLGDVLGARGKRAAPAAITPQSSEPDKSPTADSNATACNDNELGSEERGEIVPTLVPSAKDWLGGLVAARERSSVAAATTRDDELSSEEEDEDKHVSFSRAAYLDLERALSRGGPESNAKTMFPNDAWAATEDGDDEKAEALAAAEARARVRARAQAPRRQKSGFVLYCPDASMLPEAAALAPLSPSSE